MNEMEPWIEASYRRKEKVKSPLHFHSHNEFEIYCFHGGNCKYLIHNQIYHLTPGDVILMNGLTLHRANPDPDTPYERSVVHFSPEWIRPHLNHLEVPELLDPFYKLNNCLLRLKKNQRLQHIDFFVEQIAILSAANRIKTSQHAEDERVERFNDAQLKMLLTQLLFQVYETSQTMMGEQHSIVTEKEKHVERIASWIDRHFTTKLSLEMLSEDLNLSKFYISHVFKEVTGATVMDYLMNCRLNRAKYLLEMHPEKSVSEVMLEAGFESSAHFSRFFRQRIGMTPTQYRRKRNRVV